VKKYKIIHIITKLELGGAQKNTIFTVENLDKENFNTILISGKGGILDTETKSIKTIFCNDLIREINPLKDIKALLKIRKIIKQTKPIIIHTHSSKAGILGRIAAKSLKIPIIIHSVHGYPFSPYQNFIKRNVYKAIEKLASKFTTHYIFVSKGDIKIAKELKIIKDNYSLIRSGFEIDKFIKKCNNVNKIKREFNIDSDKIVIGTIAPFKPQKGLFDLIEIAKSVINKNKNVVFFIAGDGYLRDKIEAKLTEYKIRNQFKIPGFITNIDEVMDIFDIGLSTSLWEGLPQSLVQMRLKKIPIIATNISGNNEVVLNNKNGFLINKGNYEEFVNKILLLTEKNELRKRLGLFNDDFKEWDANVMVKRQEELYLKLIKNLQDKDI